MKSSVFIALMLFACVFSCSKKETPKEQESNVMLEEPEAITPERGLTLINASDCRTCHIDSKKLIGPSYKEVSEKYTDEDIDAIADRIIKGSTGIWGKLPMAPHSDINKNQAKAMAMYIMNLKLREQ